MTILDITLLRTRVQFSCAPEEEGNVRHVAHLLSQRLEHLRNHHKSASDVFAFATALMLMEDEIQSLKRQLEAGKGEEHSDKAVIQTIQAFREYIETLAEKYTQSLAQS